MNVKSVTKWAGICGGDVVRLVFLPIGFYIFFLPMDRSFILSRPSRRKLKQSGILKERVFGCDLGEHLLNSGRESKFTIVIHRLSTFLTVFSFFRICLFVSYRDSSNGLEMLRRIHRGIRYRRRYLPAIWHHVQHSKAQVSRK